MLITSSELSASTADAALQFSVPALASASFASAPSPSSRFGKFVSVSSLGFVALLATVQALCSLTSQVLELYRLDEIVVLYQVSCPRNSLHCTSSRCSATQSCLLDVAVRQCLPVFELLSCEDQSLLVGMNAFLVFTLVMVSLAFFSHHWNASCCC